MEWLKTWPVTVARWPVSHNTREACRVDDDRAAGVAVAAVAGAGTVQRAATGTLSAVVAGGA